MSRLRRGTLWITVALAILVCSGMALRALLPPNLILPEHSVAGSLPGSETSTHSAVRVERQAAPPPTLPLASSDHDSTQTMLCFGRVVDALTGTTVGGATVHGPYGSSRTTSATGEFQTRVSASGQTEITAKAPGYHETTLTIDANRPPAPVIVLVPNKQVLISVIDRDGNPAPRASVFAAPVTPSERPQHLTSLGYTDEHGLLRTPLGTTIAVFATDNRYVSSFATVSPFATELRLSLTSSGSEIGVRSSETGSRLSTVLHLSVANPTVPAQFLLAVGRSGASGTIVPNIPYAIASARDADGNNLRVERVLPDLGNRRGLPVLGPPGPENATRWIEVARPRERLIQVMDADEAIIPVIDVNIEAQETQISTAVDWHRVGRLHRTESPIGLHSLDHVFVRDLSAFSQTRLRVHAVGHADGFVYDPFTTVTSTPVVVVLPSLPSRKLRLHCGTEPLRHRVAISSTGDTPRRLIVAQPSSLGEVSVACALGTQLSIRLGDYQGPLVAEVEARATTVDLDLDCTASIRTSGKGTAEWICSMGTWQPLGEVRDDGHIIYSQLPAGSYFVGHPLDVARELLRESWGLGSRAIQVGSGAHLTVETNEEMRQLKGRCEVHGVPHESVSIAVRGFIDDDTPFHLSPTDVWRPVAPDGSFTIEAATQIGRERTIAYVFVGQDGVVIPLGCHPVSACPSWEFRSLTLAVQPPVPTPLRLRTTTTLPPGPSMAPVPEWRLLAGTSRTFWFPSFVGAIDLVTAGSSTSIALGSTPARVEVEVDESGGIQVK